VAVVFSRIAYFADANPRAGSVGQDNGERISGTGEISLFKSMGRGGFLSGVSAAVMSTPAVPSCCQFQRPYAVIFYKAFLRKRVLPKLRLVWLAAAWCC